MQKLSELFDTEGQDKAEEAPAEEDVGSPVQLTSEWEVELFFTFELLLDTTFSFFKPLSLQLSLSAQICLNQIF